MAEERAPYVPPQDRFIPAAGLPEARLFAKPWDAGPLPQKRTFVPQKDRQVPLMEGAMQPSEFAVDEKSQMVEHFEILTYKRIREEVIGEMTKQRAAQGVPALPPAPVSAAPVPAEERAVLEEVPRLLSELRLPEPASRIPGPSAQERVRELQEEREALLRAAKRVADEIAAIRETMQRAAQ